MEDNIILKGFEEFPNFRASEWPEVVTPANLGYQAVEHRNSGLEDADHDHTNLTGELHVGHYGLFLWPKQVKQ